MEGALRQVDVDKMAFIDRVRIGRGLTPSPSEELPADQASIDVGTSLERNGTRRLKVEVQEGSLNGVEIRTRLSVTMLSFFGFREILWSHVVFEFTKLI